ncbi:MAG TPA: PhzF family phenazine biosynthesis protein [Burkholderiales bacterium]|nr:PhzF family phenazine biosynthesis protein [Burkholderiales bacterium]
MQTLRFKQVDVFTSKPYFGNPVAVVVGAEGLDTDTMQRIANWTNLSETTFLLKSTVADYKLRIFTPRYELPFAGHPTIGSAHAALEAGFVGKKTSLRQECGAGILDLSLEEENLFVKGPRAAISDVAPIPGFPLASAAKRIDVGPVWVVAEVKDAKALAELKPDMAALGRWTETQEATGVTVFAKSDDCVAAIHVRSFAPAHGVPEDPVCGSGNLSVAAFLQSNSDWRFGKAYVARQGAQMGRDGRVHVRITEDGIRIGGCAVTTVDGTIRL